MTVLRIPSPALVVLIGPSGAGKSTFARRHFKPTEILSSDTCRGLVSDDENDQSATADAFAVLGAIADRRLAGLRTVVVDATSVRPEDRKPLVELARRHHVLPVAVVFRLREQVCVERNLSRPDRTFGAHVVRGQASALRQSMKGLEREGFRIVHVFHTPEEVDAVTVERTRLWNDRRDDTGPFDFVGDVHGCFDELEELLGRLGYAITRVAPEGAEPRFEVVPPPGRKAAFLGDLVDRGPKTPEVLRLVMDMCASGAAICVPGNHDVKLMRKLRGRDVSITHGLAESLAQLERESEAFRTRAADFIDALVAHYVLDGGNVVMAHAGLKQEYQGRASGVVREFALYGETTGETDEYGLPVRYPWAEAYRGRAAVVYGHTPVPEPEWLNGTICLDTGCVFGGRLTALRWPERELVSVPARAVYFASSKPFLDPSTAPPVSAQQAQDDLLDADDVLGKRRVTTRLAGPLTIRAENAAAALEVMSRFAVHPKWLVYLPPTMSPVETSARPDALERPEEAFTYFREEGVDRVVCEEKHMGSRAVLVIARDAEAARRRFGVTDGAAGVCLTRTGRRFWSDPALETALVDRVRAAMSTSGLFDELATDWAVIDAELLPWSAKALALLRTQYAPVGAAARHALSATHDALARAAARVPEAAALRDASEERLGLANRYVDAYRRYCWDVEGLDGVRVAPFHLLATEGGCHVGKDHLWHLSRLSRLAAADPALLLATRHLEVDTTDEASLAAGVAWWEELTAAGGEGMVVKPLGFVAKGRRGLAQPAVKVRGAEYLRIIYGPEYTRRVHLDRLRERGLGAKRSLARREFALGVEALERFVRREPLRRVHECVFAVLALESEPVDPRL